MFHIPHHTALHQQFHETEDIRMFGQQVPVEPTRIIILTIGVIVATLTTSHLVAHQKHGQTRGKHGYGEKILYLPVAQPLYCGIVRRTFKAAVAASVVIAAIAVVFTVFLVVLLVVGDNVVEGEAIVAGNEIHALLGFTLLETVNAWAAEQTVGHAQHGIVRTAKKVSNIIA